MGIEIKSREGGREGVLKRERKRKEGHEWEKKLHKLAVENILIWLTGRTGMLWGGGDSRLGNLA
ncbi:MAG: hypothetical protein Q8807_04085, partial ['Waltheria sp.' little leaf phytoplasma]|nr:hypothetical protein ['Waltheria sp.' little leaf phytoplasma]